ncbi:hypothetical protein SISSUDRAFT_446110 [Sistotremastrum suecicum HHB10207 ss-3]|uniref:Uncharacterized protein n=1 Tax=Sistotremastrum suecicum HHB10207 ss-3 TaxID=1314776 RepID=A0A166FFS6_9AGAM|nr:hypothetical protein SISSUDRAFT_446110 [Sistotremastrum suecicum HHB10207 ss-3]
MNPAFLKTLAQSASDVSDAFHFEADTSLSSVLSGQFPLEPNGTVAQPKNVDRDSLLITSLEQQLSPETSAYDVTRGQFSGSLAQETQRLHAEVNEGQETLDRMKEELDQVKQALQDAEFEKDMAQRMRMLSDGMCTTWQRRVASERENNEELCRQLAECQRKLEAFENRTDVHSETGIRDACRASKSCGELESLGRGGDDGGDMDKVDTYSDESLI